jgi:hypothetical protein
MKLNMYPGLIRLLASMPFLFENRKEAEKYQTKSPIFVYQPNM